MRDFLSGAVKSIPPSGIRKFFDIAAEMDDIITLGVGEPDFATPWHVREEGIHALEKGFTMYTSNQGLLELREEIAHKLESDFSISYNPKEEILVTVGVSEGLDLAMRATLSAGDEVLIVEPCYVSYQACVILCGAIPVSVPTSSQNNFIVSPDAIAARITSRTKAILLCYPNNPTGATLASADLYRVAELAQKHDLLVFSDEIYSKLLYEGKHVSIASLEGMKGRTIMLNGFSKSHAMTGWRIGYAAGPADLIAAMTKIHQYTMLCAPIAAQKAAIEALREGDAQMEFMRNKYNQRRRFIVKGLNDIGLTCAMPQGAFYSFASIESTNLDDAEFAERLLYEARVAVVPGSVFGESGKGFIRCSYASSIENINEALKRIGTFVAKL
jgi:aminotransferase